MEKTVPPRVEVLHEAADLIDGDRNASYGPPTENFRNIADMWNVRFRHYFKEDCKFTSADVAEAMILLKVARGIAGPKRDTAVDLAGYAGCLWECQIES